MRARLYRGDEKLPTGSRYHLLMARYVESAPNGSSHGIKLTNPQLSAFQRNVHLNLIRWKYLTGRIESSDPVTSRLSPLLLHTFGNIARVIPEYHDGIGRWALGCVKLKHK